MFSRIMDLTKLLNKYSLAADKIYLHSSGDITIYFGQIKVSMGSDNSHIEDKLQLLPDFLEKLQGKSGTCKWKTTRKERVNLPSNRTRETFVKHFEKIGC